MSEKTRKQDRRTRYTRQTIKDTFLELLKQKSFTKITVTEICKNAEINRGTFYLHYYDIYDVLSDIFNDMTQDMLTTVDHLFCLNQKSCSYPFCQKIQMESQYRALFLDDTIAPILLEKLAENAKEGYVKKNLKEPTVQEIAEEIGLTDEVDVIAVGSHDTASAVYAIPSTQVDKSRCAFLSSGTWSLLGVELDEPILTEEACRAGFTNEGGVGGKIRFLQNITGLWILQRLMAQWKERGERCEYDFLLSAAESADIPSVIDVDDKIFQNPVDMEDAIAEYCEAHGHPIPETYGEVVRCVLQSLALRYKQGIDQLNRLLPAPIEQLNIIGGGCRNSLLNRLTAEALGIPVYAGPVEATAIGNILVQAIAKGEIGSREEIKEFI